MNDKVTDKELEALDKCAGHPCSRCSLDRKTCHLLTESAVKELLSIRRQAQEAPKAEDLQEVIDDYRRLTRELDVALNGDGSAKQASLCDIVAQVKREKGAPKAASQSAENEMDDVTWLQAEARVSYLPYRVCDRLNKIAENIKQRDAAQRQIGRDEALGIGTAFYNGLTKIGEYLGKDFAEVREEMIKNGNYGFVTMITESIDKKIYDKAETIEERYAEVVKAARKAERFIRNGVEMGYIKLPALGDPALNTLPAIHKALSALDEARE